MRLGLGLDRLLADLDGQLEKYKVDPSLDPFSNAKLIALEELWAYMRPLPALKEIVQQYEHEEFWILTERPKSLHKLSYNWLLRNGVDVTEQHIVYNTIKRFDCRINNIDIHIDSSFIHEDWYQYDHIVPILWSEHG